MLDKIINIELMKNPYNWIVIPLIAALISISLPILFSNANKD
jgi:hypothetical protein